MPKSKPRRIGQRGQVEVSDSVGSSGVPAAIRAHSDGGSGGRYVGSSVNGGLTAMSSVLSELARQAEKAENRAYAEAQKQEARAYAEAKEQQRKAEAREEAKLNAFESLAGKTAKLEYINSVIQRNNAGEFTSPDAFATDLQSQLDAYRGESPQFLNSFASVADQIGNMMIAKGKELSARTEDRVVGTASQFQDRYYDSLLSASVDDFVKEHNDLVANLQTPGRSDLEAELMVAQNFISRYNMEARANPELAERMYDYGREWMNGLTSGTARDLMKKTFENGVSVVRHTAESLEERSIQEAAKAQKTAYHDVADIFMRLETTDLKREMYAKIIETPDDFQAKLGKENYLVFLEKMRTEIERDERADETQLQREERASERIMGVLGARIDSVENRLTMAQIENQEGLLEPHKSILRRELRQAEVLLAQGISTDVNAAYSRLLNSIPTDAKWTGGFGPQDGVAVLDPRAAIAFQTKLNQAARRAALSVEITEDPASYAQRNEAIRLALDSTVTDILDRGHEFIPGISDEMREAFGEPRPKATVENATVDLDKFPEQREDIKRALFSGSSGRIKSSAGPSIPVNWRVYENLSPSAKQVAHDLIQIRGVEEQVKEKERYSLAPLTQWFGGVFDYITDSSNYRAPSYEDGFRPREEAPNLNLDQ